MHVTLLLCLSTPLSVSLPSVHLSFWLHHGFPVSSIPSNLSFSPFLSFPSFPKLLMFCAVLYLHSSFLLRTFNLSPLLSFLSPISRSLIFATYFGFDFILPPLVALIPLPFLLLQGEILVSTPQI